MSNRQESFPGEADMHVVTVNNVVRLKKPPFLKNFCKSHICLIFKFFIFYSGFLYEHTVNFIKNIGLWTSKWNSNVFSKIPFFIIFVSLIEIGLYYFTDNKLKRILLYDPKENQEVWRFFTYILIHKDEIHLSLNLIIQGFVGFIIEFEQGHFRTTVIYFGGGLAGSLGTFFFSSKLMAGASGAVYSLLTSHIPNILLNNETIKHLDYRIFAVTVLILSDAIHICYHILFRGNDNPMIGWEAHVSGALAGLMLGFSIFKGTLNKKTKIQEYYNNILHHLFW